MSGLTAPPTQEGLDSADTEPGLGRALTLRALLLAVGLLVLANLWMMYAELVTLSAQVTMSVPPIPALIGLIILLAARPLGGLFRLSRRELLFVYAFLTLSVALTSGGALREFFPEMTALQYFATPENGWEAYVHHQPSWLFPHDPEVVRAFYEGGEGGVPWGHWALPLAGWSVLFLLILGTMLCVALLFHDEWEQREKLAFPITELPLAMTAPSGSHRRIPAFWRDPVMWLGFGLAAVHNGLNILHAFHPAVPALGFTYSFEKLFTERPWTALGELTLFHRPEVLGFAYLMPQEIVVSSLAFYALLLGEGTVALAAGYDIPRFPHAMAQSGGAFVAFALILIYMARRHLRIPHPFPSPSGRGVPEGSLTPFPSPTGRGVPEGRGEGSRSPRWPVLGLALGLLGIYAWGRAAGLSSLTIILFFGLLLLMALTYARLRAQAGLPEQWGYPVTEANRMITAFVGSEPFRRLGGLPNLTMLYSSWFLTRGYLPNLSAYHFESLHIAQESRITRREMVTTLLLAMVLGMVVSYATQLHAGYAYGTNFLEGGTHGGGMRVADARSGFNLLRDAATTGVPPDRGETIAILWGAVATVLLTVLRYRFPRFPLHHLGFIIGTTRGYRVWSGLLLAALIKSAALRIGGVGLYRRLIPGAVGLILGHFVLAGGVWSIAAVFGGEAYRAYEVWFG